MTEGISTNLSNDEVAEVAAREPRVGSNWAERLRAKLKQVSKGDQNTWGLVALFMEMIDAIEKETAAPSITPVEEEVIAPTLRLLREFVDKDLKVGMCYASIVAELRGIVKAAQSRDSSNVELLAIHEAVMNPMDVKSDPADTFTLKMVKEFILRAVTEKHN